MAKKRIIVEVHEDAYGALLRDARNMGMTLSNYIRKALGIPLERQGVKGMLSQAPKKGKKQKPTA